LTITSPLSLILRAVSVSLLLRHPRSTLFPYTTLFRSKARVDHPRPRDHPRGRARDHRPRRSAGDTASPHEGRAGTLGRRSGDRRDRKSTRLNSSHVKISYAVFCLKKKKSRDREIYAYD